MHELRLDFGSQRQASLLIEARKTPDTPLRTFLQRFPARVAEPLPTAWLDLPMSAFQLIPSSFGPEAQPALSTGSGLLAELNAIAASVQHNPPTPTRVPPLGFATPAATAPIGLPSAPPALTDSEAVALAYAEDIIKIGRYLSNDLSVLVVCDKILAESLYRHAVRSSNKRPILEGAVAPTESGSGGEANPLTQRESAGALGRILALGRLLAGIKADQVLVLRHLDTLAGGTPDGPLTADARLLTEVLYRSQEFTPTILGFADPSLGLPKVITDRFAIHIELAGLSREAIPRLVTVAERERFASFDAETLFKNVSGFNAIQLRNALRYVLANSQPATPTAQLMTLIREFKRGSGDEIAIPDVTFDDIGGYAEVKWQVFEAIELITGKQPPFNPDGSPPTLGDDTFVRLESAIEREQRRKLAPRGFIFHGPPGTGKTLFAKAIANAMNATIQLVNGPEIMDMWLGKSESNLRRIFTIARRNAPAVIFFDEFDSIAARRGNMSDGGSRASNAVVAQLLTELDGFRADQDILVIGTTNRLDIIDEALLRPSRLQPIHLPLPDTAARRGIAAIHARTFNVALPTPTLLDQIAAQTAGCNGDEVRAIFQEIARLSRRRVPITPETYGTLLNLARKRREERRTTPE